MRILVPCAEAIFFFSKSLFPTHLRFLLCPPVIIAPSSGCSKPGGAIDPHTDIQDRRVGTFSSPCYLQTALLTDLVHAVH